MDGFDFHHGDDASDMTWNSRHRAHPFPAVSSYLPTGWPLAAEVLDQDASVTVEQRSLQHAVRAHAFSAIPRRHDGSTGQHPATVGLGLAAHHLTDNAHLMNSTWQYAYHSANPAVDSNSDGSYDDRSFEPGYVPVSAAHYIPVGLPRTSMPLQVPSVAGSLPHYMPMTQTTTAAGPVAAMNTMAFPLQQHYQHSILPFNSNIAGLINAPSPVSPTNPASGSSPSSSTFEVCSLSSSDQGWTAIGYAAALAEGEGDHVRDRAVFNPGETLHIRSDSSSSSEGQSDQLSSSYEDMPFPLHSPLAGTGRRPIAGDGQPISRVIVDFHAHDHEHSMISSPGMSSLAISPPSTSPRSNSSGVSMRIRARPLSVTSASTSPTGASAAARRRRSPPSNDPLSKTTSSVIRKEVVPVRKAVAIADKQRSGGRKGPLSAKSRAQASEIRKLRACLRCKFLKKTCDKGDPCQGCHARHARLWQVPCTRIDIKDVGNFIDAWDYDHKRHVTIHVSTNNVRGFGTEERTVYLTHGFGHYFPINTRHAYVVDDKCLTMDWIETQIMMDFEGSTGKLATGIHGVPEDTLMKYVDKHLDEGFDDFVRVYFQGTPFLTQILGIAYKYYLNKKTPVIRNALKLVIAYTLTVHITLIDGLSEAEQQIGKIDNKDSRFYGMTLAPVMIHLDVKIALGKMWRELQREVLEELSQLYSSVYQGDKLKNWPTIFMVACILLAVWELIQFDCHYREPDEAKVERFCTEMEQTPVGVIVGLFSAISQKLPAISEWDTAKHGHTLNKDEAICDALTEVRDNVNKHQDMLMQRAKDAHYTRDDFDCLANKFLSRMVIRATA